MDVEVVATVMLDGGSVVVVVVNFVEMMVDVTGSGTYVIVGVVVT